MTALAVCRHLEALWFANVANSILWWAFVKVCYPLAVSYSICTTELPVLRYTQCLIGGGTWSCCQPVAVPLQAWWRALITRLFCCCSKMVSSSVCTSPLVGTDYERRSEYPGIRGSRSIAVALKGLQKMSQVVQCR